MPSRVDTAEPFRPAASCRRVPSLQFPQEPEPEPDRTFLRSPHFHSFSIDHFVSSVPCCITGCSLVRLCAARYPWTVHPDRLSDGERPAAASRSCPDVCDAKGQRWKEKKKLAEGGMQIRSKEHSLTLLTGCGKRPLMPPANCSRQGMYQLFSPRHATFLGDVLCHFLALFSLSLSPSHFAFRPDRDRAQAARADIFPLLPCPSSRHCSGPNRLSGYLLLPLFLFVFFLGATQTLWTQQHSSWLHRLAITLALVGVAVAGAARVRSSKLPKLGWN